MRKIVLSSHDAGTPGGPVDKLAYYLKKNDLILIKHPLFPTSQVKSRIISENRTDEFKLSPKIQYLSEGILTALKISPHLKNKNIDLAVCFDPLSFMNLYLFNFIYKAKKIIYYNLDYSEKRFANPIMSNLYTKLHKFSYRNSDYFFSLREGTIEKIDPQKKYSYKNFVVGQTVKLRKVKVKKTPNSLVYAGATGKSIDFLPLLKALSKLKKKSIGFHLDIYGEENLALNTNIKKLRLEKEVKFKTPIDSEELNKKILPYYKIGLSPYKKISAKDAPDYLFQGKLLSAKVVDYIASGMPVIATKINPAFDDIEERRFGFLAQSENEWVKALEKLLLDKNTYREYSSNARVYAKKYDEKKIYGRVFDMIFRD